ncbi:ribosome alternative rescue factor ArfA [Paenibacillus polymyxa]|uniref:ribosome alternative rescue factor ArfA n=1 Tax=Paenibacillus polymyxa TaxID=1406 RepID=UPI0001E6D20B|nr:ribosome alternative rescue factor ArfA [Paenibacillus polymyxa]WPQ60033.1 ribosome alternative rescue factor ArfA [Paenibacillus polymyxa]
MNDKKLKKTIGEMSKSRHIWMMNPQTKIVHNRKGKGSYNRQATKKLPGDL